MRWWDYTGYFLNLDGRICGEGLIVFAIGGMAAVYLLDMIYSHHNPNIGEGITDYDAYKDTSFVEYDYLT